MTDTTVADTPPGHDGEEAVVTPRWWIYPAALVALVFAWLVAGLIFHYVPFIFGINLGYVTWTFGLLHIVTGLEIITPDLMAGVLVFGFPTIIVTGGPVVAPVGIMRLVIFTRGTVEMELPDEPENIYHGDDTCPPGKRPPIRITFANGTPEEMAKNPLKRRVTTEVSVFVRFRILDLWVFYVRMGASIDAPITQNATFAQARRQLEDMSVSVLQEDLTKQTLDDAIQHVTETNDKLDDHVREHTKRWGTEIIDVRIKLFGPSHSLNTSIQSIAISEATKQSTIIEAEGAKQRRILEGQANREAFREEGQGRADATKADLEARTKGMQEMAEALKLDPAAILGAETARTISQGPSDKIIVGTDGFKDLLGVGAAIAAGMKNGTSTPPTTT